LPGLGEVSGFVVAAGPASGKYSAPVLPQADSMQAASSKLLPTNVLISVSFTARLMFFVPQV
jgi:hypothetical protein